MDTAREVRPLTCLSCSLLVKSAARFEVVVAAVSLSIIMAAETGDG